MSNDKIYSTPLTKVNNTFFPMIENQLIGNGIDIDDYQKKCVLNAISSINNVLDTSGVNWNDPQLDKSNITQVLLTVASLKLNSSASPNEVYFTLRNVPFKKRNDKGEEIKEWRKQVELGIEGDGNDAILSNFGRGVKEVRQHWLVRENDTFEYPMFDGLDMSPPKWQPTGNGKVVKVVYPIIKQNDVVEFYITEREEVLKNLIAHVNNNLMYETFGIAKKYYDADAKGKENIRKKKNEILEAVKAKGLDEAIADPELNKYMSPAWKNKQSKEAMIVRKMRNNIVKKIPKDFGNTLAEINYENTTNDNYNHVRQEIASNANSENLDIEDDTDEIEEGEYKDIDNSQKDDVDEPSHVVIDSNESDKPESDEEAEKPKENKEKAPF